MKPAFRLNIVTGCILAAAAAFTTSPAAIAQQPSPAGTATGSAATPDEVLKEGLSILDALDSYVFEAKQAEATRIRTAAQLESAAARLRKATAELEEANRKYRECKDRLAATLRMAGMTDTGVFETLFVGDANLESARRAAIMKKLAARQAADLKEMVDAYDRAVAVEFVAGMERAQSWALAKEGAEAASRLEEETARRRSLLQRLDENVDLYSRRSSELSEAGRAMVRTIQARLSSAPSPVDFETAKGRIGMPLVGGSVLVPFGDVVHPKFKTTTPHPGWTLAYPSKGPRNVRNIAFGRVVWTGRMRGFGTTIVVDHASGWFSVYGGLSNVTVREGSVVRAGDIMGDVEAPPGDSRVTMYFEIRRGSTPIDPADYIPADRTAVQP